MWLQVSSSMSHPCGRSSPFCTTDECDSSISTSGCKAHAKSASLTEPALLRLTRLSQALVHDTETISEASMLEALRDATSLAEDSSFVGVPSSPFAAVPFRV